MEEDINLMKAVHKYKNSKNKEHMRRMIQSMGYKFTIWDMPHVLALMERAGITIYTEKPSELRSDVDTITL
jgi:hypothetical protein